MDTVQTLVNAAVVAAIGIILGWMVHGMRRELDEHRSEVASEIRSLRGEMGGFRDQLGEEIGGLRTEMREEIGGLRTEMREEFRGVRADMTQIALAVGARPRAENA
jgi:hypothetical protein